MSRLVITRGLPGSGKTTWAKAQPGERVNRDDIRLDLFGPEYARPVRAKEELVTEVQVSQVLELLNLGVNVIADDTNLSRWLPAFVEPAVAAGHRVVVVEFHVSPETCVARDAGRLRPVGEAVITGMFGKHFHGGRMQSWGHYGFDTIRINEEEA